MRQSLRLIYFRKQHTFRAASCVSAWARAVNVQRYRRRGVSLAEEPFKWDKLYRNTALLIPFLGVLQSCLHMKRGEAQSTPDSESNHQERVFWQRTWMLKKGYGAGSGSLMWVNEEQVAENTEKKSKWRATPRGEREGSDCPATAANKDWHNERRGINSVIPTILITPPVWICQWLWSHGNLMVPWWIKAHPWQEFSMLLGEPRLRRSSFSLHHTLPSKKKKEKSPSPVLVCYHHRFYHSRSSLHR